MAGATHGVAKRATIIPLRVGRPNSSGICGAVDTDRLHAALRFVVDHHKAGQPAVANLSLGGWADPDVDAAVRRVVSDGVSVVAAAGNTGDWACNYSPGRVGAALTVAATDKSDYSPMWSNYGSCVDLFAPGVGIRSAAHTSRTGTVVYDGTSMAAPHVTGAVARYLQGRPGASPKTVHAAIVKSAATGRVSNPGSSTPNRLLLVKGAVPTRLAASASASTTTVDEPIAIRGALTNRVSGTVLAGRTVVLQSRRVGATSWSSVTSKNTDARGEVAFSHQPGRSTEYRLSHGGTALTQAATSQVRTVKVRQSVVANASAVDGLKIGATIRPQPASGDRVTVLLEWQDPSTGTWVEVDRSDWRGTATDGSLAWSAAKPPSGEHRLRVRALATTRNVAGTSAPIRVVVPGEGCTTEACPPAAAPPVFVRG
ncbi:S8 family serine peptidase [Egicoccus sp. AB-alg2]|uniref:S8 family serine peptidase n=1 Tax=Egicoccus sp. AB-alg2 TaxID=3242693 RepID=UPI00359EDE00